MLLHMTELRPDIAAARVLMKITMGAGSEIKNLDQYVPEPERVERMAAGKYGKRVGLAVLTDRRLLFVQHGVMVNASDSFRLRDVTAVHWKGGLLTGAITVTVAGTHATITNVNRQDGEALVAAARARAAAL